MTTSTSASVCATGACARGTGSARPAEPASSAGGSVPVPSCQPPSRAISIVATS
jgi:hypothetical protein